MTLRKTLLAATMLALPLAAQAQPVSGIYVAAGAGVNWHERDSSPLPLTTINPAFTAPTTNNASLSTSTGPGFVGVLSAGWGFGNGLRVEVEGNYRNNDVDSSVFRSFDSATSPAQQRTWGRAGYISTMGVMANIMYDIGSTMNWPVYITVGGGIGYAWNRWSGVGASTYLGFGDTVRLNDTTGGFAWQGIAGVTYPIRAVPGLSLTAEYRYFSSQTGTINGTYTISQAVGNQIPWRTSVSPDNNNQSVLVGVRYNFGRAPAPAPIVAAPAPARSFLVFFDFASDQLTARAREIVGQAAAAARTQQVTRIEVAGHTDTVGSAQYNQGLSIRRANNVAAELVRQGVPRNAIHTAGYGFSRPLVPTGPNVREPQNRRVEIVLR